MISDYGFVKASKAESKKQAKVPQLSTCVLSIDDEPLIHRARSSSTKRKYSSGHMKRSSLFAPFNGTTRSAITVTSSVSRGKVPLQAPIRKSSSSFIQLSDSEDNGTDVDEEFECKKRRLFEVSGEEHVDGWACSRCTLVNENTDETCGACAGTREEPSPRKTRSATKTRDDSVDASINKKKPRRVIEDDSNSDFEPEKNAPSVYVSDSDEEDMVVDSADEQCVMDDGDSIVHSTHSDVSCSSHDSSYDEWTESVYKMPDQQVGKHTAETSKHTEKTPKTKDISASKSSVPRSSLSAVIDLTAADSPNRRSSSKRVLRSNYEVDDDIEDFEDAPVVTRHFTFDEPALKSNFM